MSALVTIPTLVTLGEEASMQHWVRVVLLGSALRVHALPFIKLLQVAIRKHELAMRLFMQSNKKLG